MKTNKALLLSALVCASLPMPKIPENKELWYAQFLKRKRKKKRN